MRLAVLDYGSGNVASAVRAVQRASELGGHAADVQLTPDPDRARTADGLVVPGVGAYAACMAGLKAVAGPAVIADRIAAHRPTLGICVGFQVLFDGGDEHGVATDGCGVWPGRVQRLRAAGVPIPHMGWNAVDPATGSRLFADPGERFYFVHSYAAHDLDLPDVRVSTCRYGDVDFVAAAESDDGVIAGTQFHPEKSGRAGLALIGRWLTTVAESR